ncbi:uncharacterized protein J7T54_000794 [Emericellopsis cladophorae]|uniref:Uncharacterized protein n=1 Tax=Emericellopsis cladophorae TaxID=2686198 RepID=A0A9P9XVA6_9HYPO|nr:uncharacterized protein J7T54_000794 [Emericellopsis cladophorae]KAI6778405.1 hypothetical protein J7T54_000794 [Emericellopsis cladophorae]
MGNDTSARKKTVFQLDTPFSDVSWPEVSLEDQDTILELLCNFLSPIGKHRRAHVKASKGKKASRRAEKAKAEREGEDTEMPDLVIPAPPDVTHRIDVGFNSITRSLSAMTEDQRCGSDAQADKADKERKPLSMIFVARGDQSAVFNCHFPKMWVSHAFPCIATLTSVLSVFVPINLITTLATTSFDNDYLNSCFKMAPPPMSDEEHVTPIRSRQVSNPTRAVPCPLGLADKDWLAPAPKKTTIAPSQTAEAIPARPSTSNGVPAMKKNSGVQSSAVSNNVTNPIISSDAAANVNGCQATEQPSSASNAVKGKDFLLKLRREHAARVAKLTAGESKPADATTLNGASSTNTKTSSVCLDDPVASKSDDAKYVVSKEFVPSKEPDQPGHGDESVIRKQNKGPHDPIPQDDRAGSSKILAGNLLTTTTSLGSEPERKTDEALLVDLCDGAKPALSTTAVGVCNERVTMTGMMQALQPSKLAVSRPKSPRIESDPTVKNNDYRKANVQQGPPTSLTAMDHNAQGEHKLNMIVATTTEDNEGSDHVRKQDSEAQPAVPTPVGFGSFPPPGPLADTSNAFCATHLQQSLADITPIGASTGYLVTITQVTSTPQGGMFMGTTSGELHLNTPVVAQPILPATNVAQKENIRPQDHVPAAPSEYRHRRIATDKGQQGLLSSRWAIN